MTAALTATSVWFCGFLTAAEPAPSECRQYTDDIQAILPNAAAYGSMTARKVQLLDAKNQVIGYLLLPPAGKRERVEGYNGVVNAAVVVSPDNKILGVVLGENNETPRFLDRLRNAGFLKRWNGKKTTETAMEIVNHFVEAAAKNDLKTVASYLYVRDQTEMDRILEVLKQKPDIGSLKPLGCNRLVKSSHKDNLMVHVYSETRKMSYAFVLMKNSNGKYQIAELGSSSRKP
ncbi:MAG: hypothetical protein E7055_04795 [Lentisphaerae bacterium]|nr:hypothetical protein [Lentisphaerota bacterium]